jgi:hypothetical protein
MSERIVNGSFLQGTEGWTLVIPPPRYDPDMGWTDRADVSMNQRSFPDGLPTLGISMFGAYCHAGFYQDVDFTGIDYLYCVLAGYPCFWSGEPAVNTIQINDVPVWTQQLDLYELTPVEIYTGDFTGVCRLRFDCYFESYQTGMDVRSVSTGGPTKFEPDWTLQIGDLE